MPQCPKCKINAFHHNKCNRCGYVYKKKEVQNSETSINEKEYKEDFKIWKQEEKKETNENENNHTPKPEINNNLINCSDCEKEISVNADACPHCGAPTELKKNKNSANQNVNPQTTLVGWGVFFIIFGVILFMTYMTIGKQYLMNNLYILMNGNVVALYNLWFYGSFVVGILGLIFIVIGSTRK